jgi:hypothetical protein
METSSCRANVNSISSRAFTNVHACTECCRCMRSVKSRNGRRASPALLDSMISALYLQWRWPLLSGTSSNGPASQCPKFPRPKPRERRRRTKSARPFQFEVDSEIRRHVCHNNPNSGAVNECRDHSEAVPRCRHQRRCFDRAR